MWSAGEVLRQVDTTRAAPAAGGMVHFQMSTLLADRDSVATRLARGPYAAPALVPPTPWKDRAVPRTPALAVAASRNGDVITIATHPDDDVRWWLVQTHGDSTGWRARVVEGAASELSLAALGVTPTAGPDIIALTPVSRTGITGAPVAIRVR
jgi:hypothetical protein